MYQFSLHFWPNWPPFPLILNFLIPHFYKSLDPIGSILCVCALPGYRKLDEVPPHKHVALTFYSNTWRPWYWDECLIFYFAVLLAVYVWCWLGWFWNKKVFHTEYILNSVLCYVVHRSITWTFYRSTNIR